MGHAGRGEEEGKAEEEEEEAEGRGRGGGGRPAGGSRGSDHILVRCGAVCPKVGESAAGIPGSQEDRGGAGITGTKEARRQKIPVRRDASRSRTHILQWLLSRVVVIRTSL